MATKKQTKSLEERIKEADVKITTRKANQDFLFLWQDQVNVIRELERVLQKRFDISGKPKAISLAANFLLREIEAEFGPLEEDDSK